MKTLYLQTTETSSGGECLEPGEDWPSYADTHLSVSFDNVARERPNSYYGSGSSFEVSDELYNADKVFLTIVRYTDGGTFAKTCGYWKVMGAFATGEEALQLEKDIRSGKYEKESGDRYLPWTGYFSGLDGVEVHCFTIQENAGHSGIRYH